MTALNAVTLAVRDLQQSKKFYISLGFEVEKDLPGWVSFKRVDGTVMLGLYPKDGLSKLIGIPIEGGYFAGMVLNYIPGSRQAVDEVIDLAEKAGGKVVNAAHDADWGTRTGHFSDPDGYVWQVSSY